MFSFSEHRLRSLEQTDLDLILMWRNTSHFRAASFHQQAFPSKEKQLQWFEMMMKDRHSRRLIFLQRETPCGFLVFTDVDAEHLTAHWGLYIGATNVSKGTGTALGYHGLEYAFTILGLRKVDAKILASNEKSIGLHKKLGFAQEGLLRQQIRKTDNYEDVYVMALFADEWTHQYKRTIAMNIFNDWSQQSEEQP